MLNRIAVSLALCALVVLSSPAKAGPTVFLSSPEDLTNITVGEVVTIDVSLEGLPVGSDFIFNLNTKVLFSSSLFQAIPDPTNSSGLTAVVRRDRFSIILYKVHCRWLIFTPNHP